ncbi:unnamed protein product [Aphanomyces euteiches]
MNREAQEAAWATEQAEMKLRMDTSHEVDLNAVTLVGGVDISFFPNSDDACATLVVLTFPEIKVVCEASCHTRLTLPYIPTFLAFREIPALLPLFDMIPTDLRPQLVLVDGNGELHPRGFGIASHLGVMTLLPTIGVAKTFLNVDGLTKKSVWGKALCTPGIENPIYVSIGNLISLDKAVEVVQRCSLYRVPEPIRQADLRSRAIIREWEKHGVDTSFKSCKLLD